MLRATVSTAGLGRHSASGWPSRSFRRLARPGFAALSTLLVAACGGDATAPDPADRPLVVEVRGVVRTDVDELLRDVLVQVALLDGVAGSCREPAVVSGETIEVRTDRYGRFTSLLWPRGRPMRRLRA